MVNIQIRKVYLLVTTSSKSGVVYLWGYPEVDSSITYIDPQNPPNRKALILRSFLESSWCLLFSFILVPLFYIANAVLGLAGFPHVPTVLAVLGGFLATYLVFLPLFLSSARKTRKEFVELGGDATELNLFMFIGMMPMGKSHWQRYKFIHPSERNKILSKAVSKSVTGPFF